MATPLLLKRSSVSGKTPTTASLALGELALNTYDGRAFFKYNQGSDVLREIVTLDGTQTLSNKTIYNGLVTGTLNFADGSVQPTAYTGPYTKVVSNTNAIVNCGYLANTGAGSFTITLPANPTTGQFVTIADDNAFGTNPLYVARNGNPIVSTAADLTLDITGVSVTLMFDGGSWNVYTQVGATGGSGAGTEGSEYNYSSFPQSLIPDTNNTYTLGNGSYQWSSAYIYNVYGTLTGNVNGNASSASYASNITVSTNNNTTGYLLFGPTGGTSEPVNNSNYFSVNSSTGTLSATNFSGTWVGSVISPTYGGTGVNNGSKTITLGGNLTTSGAYTTTLTATANTSVTLPTTGTLATLAGSETLTNKTIAAGSNTISGLTNSNLSGSAGISNANLANSTISGISLGSNLATLTIGTGLSGTSYNGSTGVTITIDSTVATLTGSQTLTNKTIAAGSNTITGLTTSNLSSSAAITNGQLANSTISGVSLGSNLNALTIGTGLSGTSYNGSGAVTIALSVSVSSNSASNSASALSYSAGTFTYTPFSLAQATTTQLGGVKVDGTTITASSGVISAPGFQPNGVTNITANNTTTTLTAATAINITVTGNNTQTIQLPDATTLKAGWIFRINNNTSSASSLTVNNNGSGQVGTVPQGGDCQVILLDNSTTNGSWDFHGWIPANILMGSSVLQLGSSSYTIAPYNSSLTIGTSTGGTTYNFATGATLSGNTKTISIGTGGVSGSTTAITIGSTYGTTITANGTWTFSTPLGNSNLANSSVTVNGTSISLGSSGTIKASTTNALTIGTGLSGTSFDGSGAVTIAIDSTVTTLTGSQTLTNKTLTTPTINGAALSGTLSGTPTFSGLVTLNYTGAGSTSTLNIAGYNSKGGTGYHDFLIATNSYGSATNPNKWFRLNSTGGLEIVNSGYTAVIFSLDDSGNQTISGNLTVNGTAGVTMPNRPAFRVYGGGTTAINATNTLTSSNWVVDYQQGSNLNGSTGIFTAPFAGLYQVNLVARWGGSANTSAIQVQKVSGGTTSTQIYLEWGGNSTAFHYGGSAVVKLAANDTLKVTVTSGTVTFDANDCWSVAYIG